MHEMACVIHQARVPRVIESAEGESPSDLAQYRRLIRA